ncbi:hypothetical protein [Paracoccus sp. IB05]|uniref:hypothetical protein n=1 Tax=Paracoccus sp. IB05 TaxID=2779367 RepID=UPI0018E89DA5|nr:hypothetical protein [Paracoccus sp. IB05]MBJ2152715.1 hypothetical protein [Paracoccus sp. IB05]
MYLDTRGFVTVGKGKMIPNADSAVSLPFRVRATGELAADEEIRAEFELIHGMTPLQARGAAFYDDLTDLYLSQEVIDLLVSEHVRGDFEAMLRLYPGFGNLPLSAQIALWEMIYNLGPAGLRQFRMLRQAILDEDWPAAAAQSHRNGPSDERNTSVFDLFMDAGNDP